MALATSAEVKAFLDISGSGSDTLLGAILEGVDQRIKRYIGRDVESATYSAELHDATGTDDALRLKHWPIISVSAVSIEGTALASAEYQIDKPAGVLYRRNATDSTSTAVWDEGRRNISATYTAGYATVPADLREATITQSAYAWRQSRPGGNRIGDRGTVLDAGGSVSYLTGPWAPGVLQTLEAWRGRNVA